jgi:hypothetical protein
MMNYYTVVLGAIVLFAVLITAMDVISRHRKQKAHK